MVTPFSFPCLESLHVYSEAGGPQSVGSQRVRQDRASKHSINQCLETMIGKKKKTKKREYPWSLGVGAGLDWERV